MLWTKAWLETRWRFTYILGLAVLLLGMGAEGGGLGSAENTGRMKSMLLVLSMIAAVSLAGAGIRTQSPFRRKSGLHGSTYFTLSLPVSRLRLLAARASFGLLETAGVNLFLVVSAWSIFPEVRGDSTLLDLLRVLFAGIVCITCFYFVSVLIATVLDETWQLYGSISVLATLWLASTRLGLPPSVNVFNVLGDASPLLTHRLPWPAMAVSLVLSALLFLAAWKVVEVHEY